MPAQRIAFAHWHHNGNKNSCIAYLDSKPSFFQVQKEKDIPNSDKKIVTKINTNISVSVLDKNELTKKEEDKKDNEDQ